MLSTKQLSPCSQLQLMHYTMQISKTWLLLKLIHNVQNVLIKVFIHSVFGWTTWPPMAWYRTLLLDFVLISRTVRKHQKFGCCSSIAAHIILFHTYAMLLVLDSLSTTQTWLFQTFMSNVGQADKCSILHFNFHLALFETFFLVTSMSQSSLQSCFA